jgi:hypothetical protein
MKEKVLNFLIRSVSKLFFEGYEGLFLNPNLDKFRSALVPRGVSGAALIGMVSPSMNSGPALRWTEGLSLPEEVAVLFLRLQKRT